MAKIKTETSRLEDEALLEDVAKMKSCEVKVKACLAKCGIKVINS